MRLFEGEEWKRGKVEKGRNWNGGMVENWNDGNPIALSKKSPLGGFGVGNWNCKI